MHAVLRAPLTRFVALGALLFGMDLAMRQRDEPVHARRIEVSPELVEALRERVRERSGHEPEAAAVDDAIASFVREEILYREALALGLDRGDLVVRRRLVQKMELLLDASGELGEPSDAELEAWRAAHAEELRQPARSTVEHVPLARDADAATIERTRSALAAGAAPRGLGVPMPEGRRLVARTDAELDRSFGLGCSAQIASLPVGTWSRPIEGRAAVHVVRVEQREPARDPSLAEVRERVLRGWRDEQREQAATTAMDDLEARWEIAVDRGTASE